MSTHRGHLPARLVAALVLATLLGACSVTVNQDSPDNDDTSAASRSLVQDGALTLDLTKRPTREGFGFASDRNFRAYQRPAGGDMLRTTVRLPGGSFDTPAYLVQGASNTAGGASDDDYTHQPKYLDVLASYPSGEKALAAVSSHADLLGLDRARIGLLEGDLGTKATVSQSRVLTGLVDDWLSVEVVLTDQDEGEVQVQYEFNVDVYHNAATDRILHDGVVDLDLRTRPTREDLGFLPSYRDADVNAEPSRSLMVRLRTAAGTARVRTPTVSSSSAGPAGRPTATVIRSTLAPEQLRSDLLAQADALGLPAEEVRSLFRGGGAKDRTFQATCGTSCSMTVLVGVDNDRTDDYGASAKYSITYD